MSGVVGDPFPLGVNYWPRAKAMYWWSDFDRGEVAEEFDVIAVAGHVRGADLPALGRLAAIRRRGLARASSRPRRRPGPRCRARAGSGRDLLHRSHERAQLVAGMAPGSICQRAPVPRCPSGGQRGSGRQTPRIGTCSTTRLPSTRAVCSSRLSSASTGSTRGLDVESGERARFVRPPPRRGCGAILGQGDDPAGQRDRPPPPGHDWPAHGQSLRRQRAPCRPGVQRERCRRDARLPHVCRLGT